MSALFGISKHYFNFFAWNSGVSALMGPGLCPPCPPHCYATDREPVWGLVYYMMVKPPVYLSVCLSVCLCLLVTIMKHAKMDKRVDIPFRMWTYGGH